MIYNMFGSPKMACIMIRDSYAFADHYYQGLRLYESHVPWTGPCCQDGDSQALRTLQGIQILARSMRDCETSLRARVGSVGTIRMVGIDYRNVKSVVGANDSSILESLHNYYCRTTHIAQLEYHFCSMLHIAYRAALPMIVADHVVSSAHMP